jgi:Kef-type K+ transport system membrane component KefB
MLEVDAGSFLAIVAASSLAGIVVAFFGRRIAVPVVVAELVLGILIGPQVLEIAKPDDFIQFFSNLGLGLLFFFAGYELDFDRLRGTPLRLAATGWLISLALAYGIGGVLAAAGLVLSLLFTGSAMATTAIGTLIPILSDAGELRTRFGTFLLAAGAMGEFGPILLITFAFSAHGAIGNALILLAFVALSVLAALFAIGSVGRAWPALERTLETSSQLVVRLTVLMIFALVALASDLGLDVLLGGFVAGIIVRVALRDRDVDVFESKLSAVGYGFLIPFFFIVSGMNFELDALLDDPARLAEVPMFLALFLVVRGVPALALYRGVLAARDRVALAFFSSTQLPLVVAITTIAVDEGHMRSVTAAALVGAAVLSTAVYPLLGLRLRGDAAQAEAAQGM